MLKNYIINIIVFLFTITFVYSISAQSDEKRLDFKNFNDTIIRAQNLLKSSDTSNIDLKKLRETLTHYRAQAEQDKNDQQQQVDIIREQLDKIGDIPGENDPPESEDSRNLRAKLNKKLTTVQAPMVAAESAYQRTDKLITNLDSIIRQRQSENLFDIHGFKNTAKRAEAALALLDISDNELENLREALSDYRSQALKEQDAREGRVKTVREQLDSLGASPGENDVSEAQVTADRRAELNQQLITAQAPMIVAQEAYKHADGLIAELDSIIRKRQSRSLLRRNPSPLNLANWRKAGNAFKNYINGIKNELSVQLNSPGLSAHRVSELPITLFFLIFGLILIMSATILINRFLKKYNRKSHSLRSAFLTLIFTLGGLIVPLAGVWCIIVALKSLELFLLRGEMLVDALVSIGMILVFAYWIGYHLFHPHSYAARFYNLNKRYVKNIRRIILTIGFVFAVIFLYSVIITSEKWSAEIAAVINFPIVIFAGYALLDISLRLQFIHKIKHRKKKENIIAQFSSAILIFCIVVAVVTPIIVAVGYGNFGTTIIFSVLQSITLIAVMVLFYALLMNFITVIITRKTTSHELEGNLIYNLYKSILVFILVCCSLPLLALIWGARVSDISELWRPLYEGINIGETRFSLADFLVFVIIFSLGYIITGIVKSTMRNTVLPNTKINVGAQNSIVTGIGYIGIILALIFAITSTGLDLSNLAIVAGALSFGIGFGLHTIVSNFVSGIILLIERPIKIGDWVEISGFSGNVREISVRATSIETFDRAIVTIPNAELIGGSVTNWTHNNNQGRVIIPISVGYNSDVEYVKRLLKKIILDNSTILLDPEPMILLRKFGKDALEFEIRIILRDITQILTVTSAINCKIIQSFKQHDIEIPFQQRVITIQKN